MASPSGLTRCDATDAGRRVGMAVAARAARRVGGSGCRSRACRRRRRGRPRRATARAAHAGRALRGADHRPPDSTALPRCASGGPRRRWTDCLGPGPTQVIDLPVAVHSLAIVAEPDPPGSAAVTLRPLAGDQPLPPGATPSASHFGDVRCYSSADEPTWSRPERAASTTRSWTLIAPIANTPRRRRPCCCGRRRRRAGAGACSDGRRAGTSNPAPASVTLPAA